MAGVVNRCWWCGADCYDMEPCSCERSRRVPGWYRTEDDQLFTVVDPVRPSHGRSCSCVTCGLESRIEVLENAVRRLDRIIEDNDRRLGRFVPAPAPAARGVPDPQFDWDLINQNSLKREMISSKFVMFDTPSHCDPSADMDSLREEMARECHDRSVERPSLDAQRVMEATAETPVYGRCRYGCGRTASVSMLDALLGRRDWVCERCEVLAQGVAPVIVESSPS